MRLSNDTDKMVAVIYKSYLDRRDSGESKSQAKIFSEEWNTELFPEMSQADAFDTMMEIKNALGIKMYITGGVVLSDEAIIYMENRFPDKVKSVLSFLSQFIP